LAFFDPSGGGVDPLPEGGYPPLPGGVTPPFQGGLPPPSRGCFGPFREGVSDPSGRVFRTPSGGVFLTPSGRVFRTPSGGCFLTPSQEGVSDPSQGHFFVTFLCPGRSFFWGAQKVMFSCHEKCRFAVRAAYRHIPSTQLESWVANNYLACLAPEAILSLLNELPLEFPSCPGDLLIILSLFLHVVIVNRVALFVRCR